MHVLVREWTGSVVGLELVDGQLQLPLADNMPVFLSRLYAEVLGGHVESRFRHSIAVPATQACIQKEQNVLLASRLKAGLQHL